MIRVGIWQTGHIHVNLQLREQTWCMTEGNVNKAKVEASKYRDGRDLPSQF
jgi:hypothetical protein